MLKILSWFILVGNVICAVGCFAQSFILIIIGRTIYGLGGDSITSSQWAMVLEYFNENEVGIALVS